MTTSTRTRGGWSLPVLAAVGVVALAPACTLDASSKVACVDDRDCLGGYVCRQAVCERPGQPGAGGRGGAGTSGAGGSAGIGGSAGSATGAGGSAAGSGGTGGGAGSGGVTATGGRGGDSGTAGNSASAGTGGGTAGRDGTGGTAGTGGAAGAGGTAGAGGSAGAGATDAAGTAGTGGTGGDPAGTGGGGTGGGGTGGGGTGGGGTGGGGTAGGGTGGTGGGTAGTGGGDVSRVCTPSQRFGRPTPVPGLNGVTNGVTAARLSPDELTAYISMFRGQHVDLYVATRPSRSEPFGTPTPLTNLNTTAWDELASVTADGLTLYMDSTRSGAWALYASSRQSLSDPFPPPIPLTEINLLGAGAPYVIPDGRALYFHAFRDNNHDVVRVEKTATGFTVPESLSINTSGGELSPVVSPDELTIYFMQFPVPNEPGGYIAMATRSSVTEPFGPTLRLPEVSLPYPAEPRWISPDGCRLYLQQTDPQNGFWVYVAERVDDPAPPAGPTATCTASAVTTCPAPTAGRCDETFCAGRLWRDPNRPQLIRYRFFDPEKKFPDSYKNAIRTSAAAWSAASAGLADFEECAPCLGRFVSVMPGDGDGLVDFADQEQIVRLPVDAASLADPPLHRIAHQWGHVLGLGHTYERADRERYVRFDPGAWCGSNGPGLPPRCAPGPAQVGSPPISSGTFGVYDEKSKMNGFASDGICGNGEPDAKSGAPTAGDAAAVQELFFSHGDQWAPFRPLGRSVSPTAPLDYQLAPGIDPTGAPALAAWNAPGVEIFVRGTGGGVYGIRNKISGTSFQGWSDWQLVGIGANSDPSATFGDAATLHLALRADNQSIRLRTRTNDTWGPWASLGGPPGGAASAPAVAARDSSFLGVVARANDDRLYVLACDDSAAMCAGSAAAADAWKSLPAMPDGRTVIGKPSAVWSGNLLLVGAATSDGRAWVMGGIDADFTPSGWVLLPLDLDPSDPQATVAVGNYGNFYGRNAQRAFLGADWSTLYPPLGGILVSAPGVVVAPHGPFRVDVAAVIEDHGRPGVWWKFNAYPNYVPPCNYNAPGTCAQCGCGGDTGIACDR